jgi:putative peptidoglycan lipid II flippase
MIATLFQSDVFDTADVAMSQRSLIAYSVGLVPFILIKVLAPGFYARQDTKTPVRIAVIAMVSNMALNVLLVFPLAHAGLALATALSAGLNATLLFRGLRSEGVLQAEPGWGSLIVRGVVAALLMGVALFWGAGDLGRWLEMGTWDRALLLTGLVVGGGLLYFSALFILGIRPRHFRASVDH